jgi:hypothetical protein
MLLKKMTEMEPIFYFLEIIPNVMYKANFSKSHYTIASRQANEEPNLIVQKEWSNHDPRKTLF